VQTSRERVEVGNVTVALSVYVRRIASVEHKRVFFSVDEANLAITVRVGLFCIQTEGQFFLSKFELFLFVTACRVTECVVL